jgi:hypothetical protein
LHGTRLLQPCKFELRLDVGRLYMERPRKLSLLLVPSLGSTPKQFKHQISFATLFVVKLNLWRKA